ncbi:hypothetical protein AB3M99_30775 [Paenibacillus taichungensis]
MILKKLLSIDKVFITNLYLKNSKSNFFERLIRLDFMALFIFATFFIPWPAGVFVYIFVLIPYLRITLIKTKKLMKWKKMIDSCKFIYINNNEYDQCARERYFKELLNIIFRYCMFIILTLLFLHNEFSSYFPNLSHSMHNSIVNYMMIYFLSTPIFGFLSLKAKGLCKQLSVLFLTNPVILLFIIFVLMGQIPVQNPRDIFFFGEGPLGSFLIIFTQAGIEKRFIIDCLIYSTIQQVIFSIVQPAYRVERGKIAVEVIAFTFGAISIIGLFFSTEISSTLYNYIEKTAYLGKDYFRSIGILDLKEFKLFFETTFKYILLPSSFCSTIPLIIFKYREYSNKSKGNKLFEKSLNVHNSREKSKDLKRAIYYGGSSIKNLILSSPKFQSEIVYLNSSKYKKTSRVVRKFKKLRRKVITFLIEKMNSSEQIYVRSKLKIMSLKHEVEEIPTFFRHRRREVYILISLIIVIGVTMYLFALNLNFYTSFRLIIAQMTKIAYSEYLGWFDNNISLANYSFFIIYCGFCTLYFYKEQLKNKKKKILDRKDTIRILIHLTLLILLFTIAFLKYYQSVLPFVQLLSIFHLLWFLSYLNDIAFNKSYQEDQ